jgi:amino acid transporter
LNRDGSVGSPGLHRGLGRFDVVALCVNSIVGAGVFALPGTLALDAGRYSLAVILAAFVVVGLLALSMAEVASRFDRTGGPQVYAEHTFGPLTSRHSGPPSGRRGLGRPCSRCTRWCSRRSTCAA